MSPETEQKPYTFSTGLDSNLSGLTEEIHQEAEQLPQESIGLESSVESSSIPEDLDNIPSDFEEEPDEEEEGAPRKLGKAVAESGGKALARSLDRIASIGLAMIAHGVAQDYRADRQELADLQEALIQFMGETGFQMSPGWNLLVAISSIYGFKIMGALQDRHEYEAKLAAAKQ